METMSNTLFYYKQPLKQKGRRYFSDAKWSLPQQRQLIPKIKKKSLNPIKIKQIYQLKIKDQLLLQKHQKIQKYFTQSNNYSFQRSRHNKNEQKKMSPLVTSNIRIRSNSINNGLYINMRNKAKSNMEYINYHTHSILNASYN